MSHQENKLYTNISVSMILFYCVRKSQCTINCVQYSWGQTVHASMYVLKAQEQWKRKACLVHLEHLQNCVIKTNNVLDIGITFAATTWKASFLTMNFNENVCYILVHLCVYSTKTLWNLTLFIKKPVKWRLMRKRFYFGMKSMSNMPQANI